jgi:hypothetical protein
MFMRPRISLFKLLIWSLLWKAAHFLFGLLKDFEFEIFLKQSKAENKFAITFQICFLNSIVK